MGTEFNADEIFEIAEQIERNGSSFYKQGAELVSDEVMRKLLLSLATWETRHEKLFAEMRAELLKKEKEPTAFDPDNEAALYLRAMADDHVFNVKDTSEILKGSESPEEILNTALGFEKDSIAYFLGMKELVPERLGKDRLDKIVREEISHVATLTRLIEDTKK
jgi:rubrerythrin